MKNSLKRLSMALKVEGDPEIYNTAINFVLELGDIYVDAGISTYDNYIKSKPNQGPPQIPSKLWASLRQLSETKKATLVLLSTKLKNGWAPNISGMDPSLFADEHALDLSEWQHRCYQRALCEMLDFLIKQPLDFASDYAFLQFLRSLSDRSDEDSALVASFLESNFRKYRTSRILRCFIQGQVTNITRYANLRAGDEKAQLLSIGTELDKYLEDTLESKEDWFLDFLPQLDGWSLHLGSKLLEVVESEQSNWHVTFTLGCVPRKPRAPKTILTKAKEVISQIPDDIFVMHLNEIEDSLGRRGTHKVLASNKGSSNDKLLHADNSDRLKGIVWMAQFSESSRTPLILFRIMDRCFHKISGVGPLAEPIGQAAIDSLIALDHPLNKQRFEEQLDKHRKNKNLRARLEKALAALQ